MQLSNTAPSKIILALKIALPLGVLALTVMHILSVINEVPLSDEWRWMKDLLIPYQQGDISLWQYITGEYAFLSHSHYFALLFILADYHWMGLDFGLMAYFGLVAYLLTWCLLTWYYFSLHKFTLDGLRYCGLLIFTIGYFSPLSDFPWLLVLFEYIYLFFAVALLGLYDLYIRGKLKFICFIFTFIFGAIFADTIGIIAVLAILTWTFLLSVLRREPWHKTVILWLVFAGILLFQYLLLGKGIGGNHPLLASLLSLLGDPLAMVKSLTITFAQPLVDHTALTESPTFKENFRAWHFLFGSVGLIISAISLWFYLADGGLRKTHLPCLLMLFGLVAWSTILISRYIDFGPYIFDARRFTRLFTLYYVGAGFALSLTLRPAGKIAAVLVLLIMSGLFIFSTQAQYRRAVHVQHYFENATVELRREQLDQEKLMQSIPRCQPGFCEESIKFLREQELSVFQKN